LTVNLKMPIKLGTQSNIKSVKVALPPQLPARLSTLQQACSEHQFNANPAGCPQASLVGRAVATTPILPEPLAGPAIFVSHGGEAFPSLILVLQGYGFTIDLVGSTNISRQGIISSTFKTIPDEPVGSFQLTMPQGPYSVLGATTNLCELTRLVHARKSVSRDSSGRRRRVTVKIAKRIPATLHIPTQFIAQNGIVIHQNTPIAVTGCTRHKARHPSAGRRRQRRRGHRRG
jgi:hypothetical protein